MRKKLIKITTMISLTVILVFSSTLVTLASTEEYSPTNPRTITEADANIIVTSDITQFYLTGNLLLIHDKYGSPDPQLINNGDGTWVLIMYDEQTVALGVNNPYIDYTYYMPQIENTDADCEYTYVQDWSGYMSNKYILRKNNVSENRGMKYDWTDVCNYAVIEGKQEGVGVYKLQLKNYIWGVVDTLKDIAEQGLPDTLGNEITLAVYVLPTQEGFQTPTYTESEQDNADLMAWYASGNKRWSVVGVDDEGGLIVYNNYSGTYVTIDKSLWQYDSSTGQYLWRYK